MDASLQKHASSGQTRYIWSSALLPLAPSTLIRNTLWRVEGEGLGWEYSCFSWRAGDTVVALYCDHIVGNRFICNRNSRCVVGDGGLCFSILVNNIIMFVMQLLCVKSNAIEHRIFPICRYSLCSPSYIRAVYYIGSYKMATFITPKVFCQTLLPPTYSHTVLSALWLDFCLPFKSWKCDFYFLCEKTPDYINFRGLHTDVETCPL